MRIPRPSIRLNRERNAPLYLMELEERYYTKLYCTVLYCPVLYLYCATNSEQLAVVKLEAIPQRTLPRTEVRM